MKPAQIIAAAILTAVVSARPLASNTTSTEPVELSAATTSGQSDSNSLVEVTKRQPAAGTFYFLDEPIAIDASTAPVSPKQHPDGDKCSGGNKSTCDNNEAQCWYHTISQSNRNKFYIQGSGPWFHDKGKGFLDNLRGQCVGRVGPKHWGFDYWTGGALNAGRASFLLSASASGDVDKCVRDAIWLASRPHATGPIEGLRCRLLKSAEQMPAPPIAEASNNMISSPRKLPMPEGANDLVSWIFLAKGDWFNDGGKLFTENLKDSGFAGTWEATPLHDGWWQMQLTRHRVQTPDGFDALQTFSPKLAVFLSTSRTGALYGPATANETDGGTYLP